jgi:hypothetical protein
LARPARYAMAAADLMGNGSTSEKAKKKRISGKQS